MAKAKKDAKFFTCYLKKELADKIDVYSTVNHLSKTAIVEIALEKFFDESHFDEPHSPVNPLINESKVD